MRLHPYLATVAGGATLLLMLASAAPTLAAAPTGHGRPEHHFWRHHDEYHYRWHAVGTPRHGTETKRGSGSGTAGAGNGAPGGESVAAGGKGSAGSSSAGIARSSSTGSGSAGSSSTGSSGSAGSSGSSGSSSAGTAGSSGTGSGGTPSGALTVGSKIDGYTVTRVLHMVATAYGPSLKDNYPYGPVDAFGKPLVAGDVAVDPSVIPLNTHLFVTGYTSPNLPNGGELAQARDTGGAIKGDRIDIFINQVDAIVANFGIQNVTVYVLS